MKLALIIFMTLPLMLMAQVFHVDNPTTTLIKNTDQSPAHWYIEVTSDVTVDTTLRWKSSFQNIPTQWNISFDDGTTYFGTIQSGDSSDFLLAANQSFPLKLIIGGTLNDTPGNGTVFFDLYDPNVPTTVVTISYHFIVSAVGIEELENLGVISMHNGQIKLLQQGAQLQIFDFLGRELVTISENETLTIDELPNETLILNVSSENNQYTIKWLRGDL